MHYLDRLTEPVTAICRCTKLDRGEIHFDFYLPGCLSRAFHIYRSDLYGMLGHNYKFNFMQNGSQIKKLGRSEGGV